MAKRVKVEGFRETEAALAQLPKSTGKNVLRRVLRTAMKPIEEAAKANAPRLSGALVRNISTGTRLTRRQSAVARKAGKSTVELHMGTADPAGVQTEFGNEHQAAEPWMRPAWDTNNDAALDTIGAELWTEIEKASARLAKKAARAAKKSAAK